jgi:hypothetical protein
MSEPTLAEARRFRRISLPKGMFVAWYGGDESGVSRAHTVSMGGLSLVAPNAPPVGTTLILAFEVPGGSVQADAIVRNIIPGEEIGVEFTRMAPKDRLLLERLLKRLFR